ncbi:MAG: hypothetical protein ACKVOR_05725 [Flavobacteriales bacterium]
MGKIRLDFGRLKPVELGEKAKLIVLMMSGNAFFTTPSPTLAAILVLADDLFLLISKAEQGSKADKQARDDKADELIEALTQLAGYVTSIGGIKDQVLLSSGFDLEKPKTPIGPLGAVLDVRTKTTGVIGQLGVRWKKLKGAHIYLVQITQTPGVESSWVTIANVPRTRLMREGVVSMQVFYFRICGIGTAGQGPWSEVADGYAR